MNIFILLLLFLHLLYPILVINNPIHRTTISFRELSAYRISIQEMIKQKRLNNTVFVTVTTYGYKEFTTDFYQNNHMQNYSNFLVVVHDMHTFRVKSLIPSITS